MSLAKLDVKSTVKGEKIWYFQILLINIAKAIIYNWYGNALCDFVKQNDLVFA